MVMKAWFSVCSMTIWNRFAMPLQNAICVLIPIEMTICVRKPIWWTQAVFPFCRLAHWLSNWTETGDKITRTMPWAPRRAISLPCLFLKFDRSLRSLFWTFSPQNAVCVSWPERRFHFLFFPEPRTFWHELLTRLSIASRFVSYFSALQPLDHCPLEETSGIWSQWRQSWKRHHRTSACYISPWAAALTDEIFFLSLGTFLPRFVWFSTWPGLWRCSWTFHSPTSQSARTQREHRVIKDPTSFWRLETFDWALWPLTNCMRSAPLTL